MAYAELHCLTNFTFLEGASHGEDLVKRAHELGLNALAITDRNSLAGVVRAHRAANQLGLKIIIGSEIELENGRRFILLPRDRVAYGRLCRLLSIGRQRGEKGYCILKASDLMEWGQGSVCLIVPPDDLSKLNAKYLQKWQWFFGKNCYLIASHGFEGKDHARIADLAKLSQHSHIPMVASNNVLYHTPNERPVADIVCAIREHVTLEEAGRLLQKNAERHLKGERDMLALFNGYEEAVWRTVEIANKIQFSLDELRYEYPDEVANGIEPQDELKRLINQQIPIRYPKTHYPAGVPVKDMRLIEHELKVVEELSYAPYFLTVYDIVRFARSQGILCQGRGSAANSILCYILGITSVSPDRMDMVFERFVSSARNEPPDIDVDFEHERREEVIQYIYQNMADTARG
jgi:error-prone DNA polymerase